MPCSASPSGARSGSPCRAMLQQDRPSRAGHVCYLAGLPRATYQLVAKGPGFGLDSPATLSKPQVARLLLLSWIDIRAVLAFVGAFRGGAAAARGDESSGGRAEYAFRSGTVASLPREQARCRHPPTRLVPHAAHGAPETCGRPPPAEDERHPMDGRRRAGARTPRGRGRGHEDEAATIPQPPRTVQPRMTAHATNQAPGPAKPNWPRTPAVSACRLPTRIRGTTPTRFRSSPT